MSSWCLWDFSLSNCLILLRFQGLVVHFHSSYGHLFHAHGLMKRHIYGQRLLIFCWYDRTCMIAQSDPWRFARYSVQLSYLPTTYRLFPSPQFLVSVSMQYWPFFPLGLGYLQLQKNPLLPQFDQISSPLGLVNTILA